MPVLMVLIFIVVCVISDVFFPNPSVAKEREAKDHRVYEAWGKTHPETKLSFEEWKLLKQADLLRP